MVSSLFSAISQGDPYELLISQMISIERQPQYALEDKLILHKRSKSILSDFDSTVSSLHKLAKSFTDVLANPFDARSASFPEDAAYKVSATDEASFGSHSLQVLRLAATDTRISQQYSESGTSLRTFFDANGAQNFSISVASPTELDPNNRVDIAVDVDPVGTTDDEILREISDAINEAMADAIESDLIEDDNAALSSVINETSDTARLSLRSGETGFAHRLQFTDSGDGLLSQLEVNNEAVAAGTGGGQITDVGTTELDSELNSKFLLDGLTLYRSTNQVSDALDGLTLDLKQPSEAAEDFTVEPDADAIKDQVSSFISKYNEVLSFIENQTMVDSDLGIRAAFAGDATFRTMRFDMRNDMASQVTGLPTGAPTLLTQLGVEINEDGTLKLDDTDKLIEAIRDDSNAVKNLFTGPDGFATRIENRLDAYLGSTGILDNRIDTLDQRIDRLDDQILDFDGRMQQREDQLRRQFAEVQNIIASLQGQQQYLGSFFGY